MASSVASRFPILTLGTLLFLFPCGLRAQEEVIPIIQGEVRAGDEALGGAMVVLHQVSSDLSGEIDSIQAGPDGTFRLRLPRVPAHGANSEVFFASVRYQGLLYFGRAITDPIQLDSLYLIQAFDTLSVPQGGAALPLSARNLFLDKVQDGWQATDFFQLRNASDRTLFSPDEGVTWQYPLPPSAQDLEMGQADMAADALRFEGGSLVVYGPIPPGERAFLVRYRILEEDFSIPMPGKTEQMEVLVRQPGPQVEFQGLVRAAPVELEAGNTFSRFEGADMEDAEVQAKVLDGPFHFRAEWLALILAGLLGGAGVFAFRARGTVEKKEVRPVVTPGRSQLILSIAELDEEFRRSGNEDDEARAGYLARRKKLLEKLEGLS